jgi:hypothetical protein
MGFLDSLETNLNKTARTQNGAVSNHSTLDYVLDFFSKAGAMRGKEAQAYKLFQKAYAQDPLLAVRCLFYLRDIRGGQGERSVFRYIFSKLDNPLKEKLSVYVEEFGRWDDIDFVEANIELVKYQLNKDETDMKEGNSTSLLAKWLPSVKTSSAATRKNALKIAKLLGLTPRQYRLLLSSLRKHIGLLEHEMTSNNWDNIDYSKIPAQAHRKHIKAFMRHDEERYKAYLASVEKGEKKINTSTLYAYEVYNLVQSGEKAAANAMWKNLPDYTRGENALVIADVSGSMYGMPMAVSVSLALYFADKNEGAFKDYFMTFSERPRLQKIVGSTLSQKMNSIERSEWGMSTNLEAAFRAILKAAIDSGATQDDMPKILYIISDMQFNSCVAGGSDTNFNTAKRLFEESGYVLPHVVFWNVNAYGDSPATKHDKNVTLISGSSQSTFQYAVAGKTPIESMNDILNSERYSKITL